jgi:flagellar FliJ protein
MFKFNLEPLLHQRRYQEEILQKELASLQTRLIEEKDQLRALKGRQRKYIRKLQAIQNGSCCVSEIMLVLNYLDQLSKRLADQNQRVLKAEANVNLKRQELIEATKKRKTLDKLKEKGWYNYQQRMLKRDRDFMDEVATHQYNRKK